VAARAAVGFVGVALLALAGHARGQAAPVDRGASPSAVTPAPSPKRVAWHDSTLLWSQRAATQTLGVGEDYQSRDPYYDWIFYARPRYYFWENETSSLSVRGQVWASIELTNSDSSTRRRELFLEDTLVSLTPEHAFVKDGEYLTDLTLSLPRVELPTSKASYQSGKIAQLGVRAYLLQAFPLRTNDAWLQRGHAALRLGYGYQFARAIVPERSTLNQLRMDLEGHSVSNDQISGAAFAEHAGVLHAVLGADLWRDVISIDSEFGIDPSYKFKLPPSSQVCILTGCIPPQDVSDPQRYQVATTFDVSLQVASWAGALKTSVGYENVTGQLGPDGERRGALWSPEAKFYLKIEAQPDLFIPKPASSRARRATHQVASGR
jgi:hypothetical protein